jgi:Zn-dependent metalloprotease
MEKLVFFILFSGILFAQERVFKGYHASNFIKNAEEVRFRKGENEPSFIELRSGVSLKDFKNKMKLPGSLDLVKDKNIKDKLGQKHLKVQQYYRDIKVAGGQYIFHYDGNFVKSANGKLIKNINVSVVPSISESKALAFALKSVNGKSYMWEKPGMKDFALKTEGKSYKPRAELFISAKNYDYKNGADLVYRFDIYVEKPLGRYIVEIDAHSGEVINKFNRIHAINHSGTGETQYDGNVNINMDFDGTNYVLRDVTRGNGIHTFDMKNGTDYSQAVEFGEIDDHIDQENNRAGVSAHYGAAMTYDYYKSHFGRNSFDGNGAEIKSYVHFDRNYVNAFWNGSVMTYGDGDGISYGPLVDIDIVGHEITHAVTQHSANLIYSNESGALNESFSDIFGELIEYHGTGFNDWLMGDDMDLNGDGFRTMWNPNADGDPDTYNGDNWYTGNGDNGGVHINSGVQNYWFYLLVEGGSGVNDLGYSFDVTGIGRDDAGAIAYRNLTVYLTETSQYVDARSGAIQSAIDLFGENSKQHISTIEAWNAVGVPQEEPTLNLNTFELNIGNVATGGSKSSELIVSNIGTGILNITNITVANTRFSVDKTNFTLASSNSFVIDFLFSPVTLGEDSTIATIFSSADTVELKLYGKGVEAPGVSVNPLSYQITLNEGDSIKKDMLITNSGAGPLEWSINVSKKIQEFQLTNPVISTKVSDGYTGNTRFKSFFNKREMLSSDLSNVKILYDVDISYYQTLKNDLEARGAEFIEISHPVTDFSDYSILFLDDSHESWTPEEILKFESWYKYGGAVFIGGDSGDMSFFNSILSTANIEMVNEGEYYGAFSAILEDHSLTQALSRVEMGNTGAWLNVANDGMVVLRYDSSMEKANEPLMAVSEFGGGRAVVVGDEIIGDNIIAQSDNQILANRIFDWLSMSSNVISTRKNSGVLAANSDTTLSIDIKSSDLSGGIHNYSIDIQSNDPLHPSIKVPVELTVVGTPHLEIDSFIQFDSTYVTFAREKFIAFKNVGSDRINVSDIRFSGNKFNIDRTEFSIQPHSIVYRKISFLSTESGMFDETMTIESNSFSKPVISVDLVAKAIEQPNITISDQQLDFSLNIGKKDSAEIIFSNKNSYDVQLNFSIEDSAKVTNQNNFIYTKMAENIYSGKKKHVKYELTEINNFSGEGKNSKYLWKDSDEPGVFYNWQDISSVGTEVLLSDDSNSGFINLGFEFPFYGNVFEKIAISSNGFISFTNTSENIYNDPLPNQGSPENSIAIMSTDLDPNNAGLCYYHHDQIGRKFIIQFSDWSFYGSPSSRFTIQYILYENGHIKLQYNSINEAEPAVVGIQNHDRTEGLTISYGNSSFFKNQYAILISPVGEWLSLSDTSFLLKSGTSDTLKTFVNSEGLLDGYYYSNIYASLLGHDLYREKIAVHLKSKGVPNIAVADTVHSSVFKNVKKDIPFKFNNLGTKKLEISDIVFSNSRYSFDETSFSVSPKSGLEKTISFLEENSGIFIDSLMIFSNDPETPVSKTIFIMKVHDRPEIEINPKHFDFSITLNDSAKSVLEISNSGNVELRWSANISQGQEYTVSTFRVNKKTEILTSLKGKKIVFSMGNNDVLINDLRIRGAEVFHHISPVSLENMDILWLSDEHSWQDVNKLEIRDWIRNGGSLIVTGDDVEQIDFYRSLLPEELRIEIFPNEGKYVNTKPVIRNHFITQGVDSIESPKAGYYFRTVSEDNVILEYDSLSQYKGQIHMVALTAGRGKVVFTGNELFRDRIIERKDNQLLANKTFGWLAGESVELIELSSYSGRVNPNSKENIEFTVKAETLPGDYSFNIEINSTDILKPNLNVPVHLSIQGKPEINCVNNMFFHKIHKNSMDKVFFYIKNTGSDVLDISRIEFSDSRVSTSLGNILISPFKTEEIDIKLSSENLEGNGSFLMRIYSNAVNEPVKEIELVYDIVPKVSKDLSVNVIQSDLGINQRETKNLVIQNTGSYFFEVEAIPLKKKTTRTSFSKRNFVQLVREDVLQTASTGKKIKKTLENGVRVAGRYPKNICGTTFMNGKYLLADVKKLIRRYEPYSETADILFELDFHPNGIAADEDILWVGVDDTGIIRGLDNSGNTIASFYSRYLGKYLQLASDGEYLYVANEETGHFSKMTISGTVVNEYILENILITDLTWVDSHDSGHLWIKDNRNRKIHQIKLNEDGTSSVVKSLDANGWNIAHNGKDLFVSNFSGGGELTVIDDGIDESSWLKVRDHLIYVPEYSNNNFELKFDSKDLKPGTYEQVLRVFTGEKNNPVTDIPVTMIVGADHEGNDAPNFAGLPDIYLAEDQTNSSLDLDDYAFDPDHPDSLLQFSATILFEDKIFKLTQNKIYITELNLSVEIDDKSHLVTFQTSADSSRIFNIAFEVRDPDGAIGSDTIMATIVPVNDSPFLKKLLGTRTHNEDDKSLAIDLNEIFDDPDNEKLQFNILDVSNKSLANFSIKNDSLFYFLAENKYGNSFAVISAADTDKSVNDTLFLVVSPVDDYPNIISSAGNFSVPDFSEDIIKNYDQNYYDIDSDTSLIDISVHKNSNSSLVKTKKVGAKSIKYYFPTGNNGAATILIKISSGEKFIFDSLKVTVIDKTPPYVLTDFEFVSDNSSDKSFIFNLQSNEKLKEAPKLNIESRSKSNLYTFIKDSSKKEVYNCELNISETGKQKAFFLSKDMNENLSQDSLEFYLDYISSNSAKSFQIDSNLTFKALSKLTKLDKKNRNYLFWQKIQFEEECITENNNKLVPLSSILLFKTPEKIVADYSVDFNLSHFQYTSKEQQKIGIYGYDKSSGKWKYLAGEAKDDKLNTIFSETGIWAVFYNENHIPIPKEFALHQNFPNPFNFATTIKFDLTKGQNVKLFIYNLLGQKVNVLIDGFLDAGYKEIKWEGKNSFGKNVGSGVYFYQLITADKIRTKKMVLIH